MTRLLLAAALVLPAAAGRAADPALVKAAAARGADHLRSLYGREGCPQDDNGGGSSALVGLALLEAGATADEVPVRHIAAYVRKKAPGEHRTYQIAAEIFFLAKLDELTKTPAHRPLIQLLGVRLAVGMTALGTWEYTCRNQVPEEEAARWAKFLESAEPADGTALHPEVAKHLAEQVQWARANPRPVSPGDNSNTHFGMIGLWVASRHGVPAKEAFAAVERRFAAQWKADGGGWSYVDNGPASVSMTAVGLLGLALGQASRTAEAKPAAAPPKADGPPKGDDPFFHPKKPAEVKRAVPPSAAPDKVAAGQALLGRVMAGLDADAPPPPGKPYSLETLQPIAGLGNPYYAMWAIERCGVAFEVEKIGGVDWHDWGCRHLLRLQKPDGSWDGVPYTSDINTAFAVLFLVKANPYRDLTNRLAGRADTQELRGARPLAVPATEAEAAANAILAAKGADFATRLAAAKDGKGPVFTQTLAIVARKAEGERKKQARDALADRLTRMTPKTLKDMLADADAEARRAACLACAMKELDESVPWLIEKITDPSEPVWKAAHAALKSLTNVDLGPPADADEGGRKRAEAAWREWRGKRGK